MERVRNWDIKIVVEIGPLVGSEFVWGKTDCATILRKTMKVMYGEEVFKDVERLRYRSLSGALKTFKRLGSIGDIIENTGGVVIQPQVVTDGDIAVDDDYKGVQNVAIRIGSRWIVSNPELGIVESRRTFAVDKVTMYRI